MPIELRTPMEPLTSLGIAGAFIAGLTGSVHCALMCGPLACVAGTRGRPALAWHVGRISAYSLVGLTLGALGASALRLVRVDITPALPWLMAAGLVLAAFEVGKHLPALPGVSRLARFLSRISQGASPVTRALALGAATPFLPCGLLYGIFLAALSTGEPLRGAALLGAFALGGLPALLAVQLGMGKLRVPPSLRKAVLLLAAGVLIFRALSMRAEVNQCG